MQALSQPLPRRELLFPALNATYPGRPASYLTRTHRFFISAIENNPHQREAVLSIFYKSHGDGIYCIQGPPGTGKTVTLVETCLHLLHYKPTSTLLLTAPSNAAADLLCSRLSPHVSPSEMLRLNAPSRSQLDVAPEVKKYCYEVDGTYGCPDRLKEYRVVVSTTISASILGGVGIKKGHFSHIIVDEAGQGMEPEGALPFPTLSPVSTLTVVPGSFPPSMLGRRADERRSLWRP